MSSRLAVPALALAVVLAAAPRADAQQRFVTSLEVAAGWVGFPDDGLVEERLVGGAARVQITPRISVGPEIAHLAGSNHSHLIITANVTVDLRVDDGAASARVTPFIVAGAGAFRTSERFPNGTFTSTEGSFTAGGGARVRLSDRVYVAGEARVGWETHVRLQAALGVRLGS